MKVTIKFEGEEGSGKTVALDIVKATLTEKGFIVIQTKEHELLAKRL